MLANTTDTQLAVAAAGFQFLEAALAIEVGVPVIKKTNKTYDFLLRFTSQGLGLEPADGRSGAVCATYLLVFRLIQNVFRASLTCLERAY